MRHYLNGLLLVLVLLSTDVLVLADRQIVFLVILLKNRMRWRPSELAFLAYFCSPK